MELRRELVADNGAMQLPGLALSLCNLASKQAEAGQLDAALDTDDESVRLVREAAQTNEPSACYRGTHFW